MFINNIQNTFVAHALACRQNNRLIYKNMNFSLKKKGILILQGQNGTGKSTLLRVLAGFLRNYTGTLLWNKKPLVDENWDSYATRVNYIGNKGGVKEHLTIKQNLLFWSKLYNSKSKSNYYIEEALIHLKLHNLKNMPIKLLSLGQRKRLLLGKLIIINTPVWLLDEPTSGLDQNSSILLENIINEHQLDGGMLLLAAHNNIKLANVFSLLFTS
jgi:heme exporter protein A